MQPVNQIAAVRMVADKKPFTREEKHFAKILEKETDREKHSGNRNGNEATERRSDGNPEHFDSRSTDKVSNRYSGVMNIYNRSAQEVYIYLKMTTTDMKG